MSLLSYYSTNLNIMNSFLFFSFLCFFAYLQNIVAENCNPPKLEQGQSLLITIFDNDHHITEDMWQTLCIVVEHFPENTIVTDYKPGALATGTVDNIKCGSGDCKADQFLGCKTIYYKNYSDCIKPTEGESSDVLMCYCQQKASQTLLDNAALRVSWNVPESPMPIFAFQKTYDPCFKFNDAAALKDYLCSIFPTKIGPCT